MKLTRKTSRPDSRWRKLTKSWDAVPVDCTINSGAPAASGVDGADRGTSCRRDRSVPDWNVPRTYTSRPKAESEFTTATTQPKTAMR